MYPFLDAKYERDDHNRYHVFIMAHMIHMVADQSSYKYNYNHVDGHPSIPTILIHRGYMVLTHRHFY